MSGDSNYAMEKLSQAVYRLSVDQGDVRERLKAAYMAFHPVTENDFPPDLRADWNWIIAQLTKFGPVRREDGTIWIGSVDNTMSRIKRSTGAKIAERIVALTSQLEDYRREEN